MKAKLIGIIICLLIITPILSTAKPLQKQTTSNTHNIKSPISTDIYAPLWEIGDYWTYSIDTISVHFEQDNQTIDMSLEIAELPLEVIDDTGDYYTLAFETSISGHSDINFDFGDGPINITITFSSIIMEGIITIEKSNLGLQTISLSFKDRFMVAVHNQPYMQLPFTLPVIPVPVTMSLSTDFEQPFGFLSFPFNTSSYWNLSAANFTLDGELESIWLNILNFVNKIAKMFEYEILPPEIAALLPVVDIKDAFIALGIGNLFSIPEVPYAFTCFSTEDIMVPAGTYNSYNISIIGGLAHCYYAPSAGNIIKISGNFEGVLPYLKDINMELIDTNYS